MSRRRKVRFTRPALVGASILLVLSLWILGSLIARLTTPEPSYEILERHDTYEVRHYPEVMVAQVTIRDSFEEAVEQAVALLTAYRSGHNLRQLSDTEIEKDKSVEHSESFRMVWPLIVEEEDGDVVVSLILPESMTPDAVPRPKDPRVRIDTRERQRIAVGYMAGVIDVGTYVQAQRLLLSELEASDLLILSEPRFAYYGSQWLFWPLRRAEVHVRVR